MLEVRAGREDILQLGKMLQSSKQDRPQPLRHGRMGDEIPTPKIALQLDAIPVAGAEIAVCR